MRDEGNLAALTSRELALEQVAHNWNGSEDRGPLLSLTFGIGQDATHNSRAAIWNQHF